VSRPSLLPRAPLGDVLRGRAPVVGSRLRAATDAGAWVSPIEARLNLGLAYGNPRLEEAEALARIAGPLDALRALALAALTSPLAFRADAFVARPYVVAAHVDNVSIVDAVLRIADESPADRAYVTHFVHPHALNVACSDGLLRNALAQADLVLPDGIGLRIAAALLGTPLIHNVNGTDLLPLLAERLAQTARPCALIGAAAGVAARCAEALEAQHPGLRISLVSHGFPDESEIAALLRDLRDAPRPPVVLVGMGAPAQERFVRRHLATIPGASVVTVGGLFDFYSGRVPRAPLALRESGLEWVHRLLLEPRRMARRYLLGNPAFLARAFLQRAVASGARAERAERGARVLAGLVER
jgi:N-acetylglucosaminyldiphosphoundecaprenol N-acetyl-beta-D-mannosaminyltransferase